MNRPIQLVRVSQRLSPIVGHKSRMAMGHPEGDKNTPWMPFEGWMRKFLLFAKGLIAPADCRNLSGDKLVKEY